MTTTTTDAELVRAHLGGDRGALAAIYDRYAGSLYDTAAAMLSDRHDAADMVQDVFCIAAERLGQLREPDRLKPWLFAVLRNEVYRRTKKRKRSVLTDFQDERTPEVVSSNDPQGADERMAADDLASLVRAAAAGLDERDQLVLELSIRQGLTGADLADALGVSAEQSYSLVHRMRDRVEKSLGALTVARAGRRDCADLADLLRGWDGEMTVLVRKRVNRHIESCATCERSRKTLAPLTLFGAAPVFAMPFGLRERVLAAVDGITPVSGASSTATLRSHRIRFGRHDGFPRLARLGRHAVAWTTGAAVAVVATGSVLVAVQSSDGSEAFGPTATEAVSGPTSNEAGDPTSAPTDSTIDAVSTPGTEPNTGSSLPADTTNSSDAGGTTSNGTNDGANSESTGDSGGATTSTRPPTTSAPTPSSIGGAGTPIATAPATTAPATAAPVTGSTRPPSSAGPTTTTTTVATTRPPSTTTTTTRPPTTTTTTTPAAALSIETGAITFSEKVLVGYLTLKNPSASTSTWNVKQIGFFSVSPASGSLAPGASTRVSITFDWASASKYDYSTLASGTFPETGPFTREFVFTGKSGTVTTSVVATVSGQVVRPPRISGTYFNYQGTQGGPCTTGIARIMTDDESGVASVIGSVTLKFGNGTSRMMSATFVNQGPKIGWVATFDLAAGSVEVSASVTVTDKLGLSTARTWSSKPATTC